jgi:hypothetical protein
MMIVFLSTLALIVGSFFIIYALDLKQRDLESKTTTGGKLVSNTEKNKVRAISFLIAIVIIIINNLLKFIVRYLT